MRRSDKVNIEILAEDKSGAVVVKRMVEAICRRELEGEMPTVEVRPHRGCGKLPGDWSAKPGKFASGLLDLLPAKCRAYENIYKDGDLILAVVMDSDNHDPAELRALLYSVTSEYAPDIRCVIGLCTEEIEAWLLGDRQALLKAYPDANVDVIDSYEQDSICGTWELLCKAVCPDTYRSLIDVGYPAIGNYKARWAENISLFMSPENNRSPSFSLFANALTAAVKNPAPVRSIHRRTF